MIAAALYVWGFIRPGLSILRTRWKEALIILGLMVLAWAWFRGERAIHRAERAEKAAAQAHTQVVVQKAQTTLSDTASQAADRASTQALNITVKAAEAVSRVQAQPGASDPVPPAVADAWGAAIDGLRRDAGACVTAIGPNPRVAEGFMPPACAPR